ncbi:hypothetical protein L6251_03100 [Candidatus Parcubacteria bacterium]|nr:hypothetical protein [Patescibacteria group bacterium]MBU4477326.1 hypothetical protein [Patescibacteria group bacterium]MCG2699375.1 hypothetical protein [Candidatus Parcubacteria bacterium]
MTRKRKRDDDLEKPKMNITIELSCELSFYEAYEAGNVVSAIDKLEACGLAIHTAKKILAGNWHLVESGYLRPGHKPGLHCFKTVIIGIDSFNIPAISLLEKILAGKIKKNGLMPSVHFHSSGNNNVERILADEKGLYFLEIKQDYERQQAQRQILT